MRCSMFPFENMRHNHLSFFFFERAPERESWRARACNDGIHQVTKPQGRRTIGGLIWALSMGKCRISPAQLSAEIAVRCEK